MTIRRKIIDIQSPSLQQGFLGKGHTARAVIGSDFSQSDPFVVLMDDILDKQDGTPAGGPHPHAGFETVSLLLEGEMGDTAHQMKGGDFQMMTAGSGIIHTETIDTKAKMRLLQLWLILPKKDRWAMPRVQDIQLKNVPKITETGLEIRLYSGSLAGTSSPVQNYVPLIVADFHMQAHTATIQHIPASYNTFLYVIEGSVDAGENSLRLSKNQIGWLDRFSDDSQSELRLETDEQGARFVLYAGLPQGDPIISHGPFIGDTHEDIMRLFREYRQGKMEHISDVPDAQRIMW